MSADSQVMDVDFAQIDPTKDQDKILQNLNKLDRKDDDEILLQHSGGLSDCEPDDILQTDIHINTNGSEKKCLVSSDDELNVVRGSWKRSMIIDSDSESPERFQANIPASSHKNCGFSDSGLDDILKADVLVNTDGIKECIVSSDEELNVVRGRRKKSMIIDSDSESPERIKANIPASSHQNGVLSNSKPDEFLQVDVHINTNGSEKECLVSSHDKRNVVRGSRKKSKIIDSDSKPPERFQARIPAPLHKNGRLPDSKPKEVLQIDIRINTKRGKRKCLVSSDCKLKNTPASLHQNPVIIQVKTTFMEKNKHNWATTSLNSNTRTSLNINIIPDPLTEARDMVDPAPLFIC